jgi:protein-disulfide isomerase
VLFAIAIFALLISGACSLMLALGHVGALSVPGCGAGSPCAEAAASVWGKLPVIGWPVAFLGLAYFAAALAALLGLRRGIPSLFRLVVRLGTLISIGFVAVIVIAGHHCAYCLAAHAGNLLFWAAVELFPRLPGRPAPAGRPLATLVVVFLLASIVLGAAEWREKRSVAARREAQLAASTARIIAQTSEKAARAADADRAAAAEDSGAVAPPAPLPGVGEEDAPSVREDPAAEPPWEGGFCGRYLYGPQPAALRLVMFTDYQCRDCNRIEEEVWDLVEARDDLSLSIKHFPMNSDCNPAFDARKHPNACWAARAAEAAGILAGNDGFWRMNAWLFRQNGGFTNDELQAGLQELGFDPARFIAVMTSDQTLARVESDIAEATWLGLHYTPMIFVNGVELQGSAATGAVTRAIQVIAAQHPPAMTHELDQPPPAIEKYIADWRTGPLRSIPPDTHSWETGASDPRVRITLWGDYQEPHTARATAAIEATVAERSDAAYSFRHFPINKACNPVTPVDKFPLGCRASQAAEAAGRLRGSGGYWQMHRWLLQNRESFDDAALIRAATELDFDPAVLLRTMGEPEVAAAIEEDCRAGMAMGLKSIPLIFVNDRLVPRWNREGVNVLPRIFDEAARQGPAPGQ